VAADSAAPVVTRVASKKRNDLPHHLNETPAQPAGVFVCAALDHCACEPHSARVQSPEQESENPLALDAETMRRLGYAVVDRLVQRITQLPDEPVWRGASRTQLESRLAEPAPESGHSFESLIDRIYADVLPYCARVDHPRFLAFVPGCPTWPGILADLIAAGHNIFQGTWLGSSGPSALELVVLDWFKEWLGFPPSAAGLLLSGGSAANLTALACARINHATDPERAVIYLSSESHSSVIKAARVLGFTRDRIHSVPVDQQLRLPISGLRAAIKEDRAKGLEPLAIVANAGATSTGAIDPLAELAALAAELNVWLHIDAAYGGFANLTERGREWLQGIERADSITLDPHKWLYQPFEVGGLLMRDPVHLARAFHATGDYLQDTVVAGAEINFGDRGIQLTRSARALKVWLSIQFFGLAAFRTAIDRSLDLAQYAQERIQRTDVLELLTPATLGIVCFRKRWPEATPAELDERNARLTRTLADSGLALISSTRVHGKYALRVCILNHRTTREDVDRVLDWIEATNA
jgi:aromatic-L-amino-acid/L-tryptophan decarboxylase